MKWSYRIGTDDRGAALPLVILMTVLLALSLATTSVLTQSTAATIRTQTLQRQQRTELVNWTLQQALRDLSPASGRMLGIDPILDPAGSCTGRLGPYTTPDGRVIGVDCVQQANSGWSTSLSSLVLVGDGSDCAGGICATGSDGGLRLTSNDALTFSGTLINLSGAWLGKNANSKILSPMSSQSSVLQPVNASGCPAFATADTSAFDAEVRCTCPPISGGGGTCYDRTFADLRADVDVYRREQSQLIAAVAPSGTAVIPTCASAARWDPNDATSPWVLTLAGGIAGTTELAKLTALTDGKTACIGDGMTKQTPILVVTGTLRFEDPSPASAMAAGQLPTAGNTWTINGSGAVVVLGAPKMNPSKTAVTDCRTDRSGAMLQFSGSSYLRLTAGQMFLCPLQAGGAVLAAPASADDAGFVWAGAANEPVFATQYGLSSGEVWRAHGMVFAPASHFRIDAQSNRTNIALSGGALLRALTLTSNPSTSAQGDFIAPTPTASGTRRVQLRFWDITRNRDLGILQVVITGTYPENPAAGYSFNVWRTLW